MKINRFIILYILSVFGLTSCFDLEQFPHDKVSTETFWKTESHAKQGMMGIYNIMKDENVFGGYYLQDGMSDIAHGHFESQVKGTYSDRTGQVKDKWQRTYEGVARTNILLQNVDRVDMDEDTKDMYKAEARFMRAFYYFHLMDFFGEVPIYDETTIVADDFMNMKKPRSSVEDVRALILEDLQFASQNLPVKWDNANAGRATKGAAYALSGKVRLYAKDYSGAIKDFEEIVSDASGKGYGYKLYPDYADLFTPVAHSSSEMIFAIQNKGGIGTSYGMAFALRLGNRAVGDVTGAGGGWNNGVPISTLVDMYENKDGSVFNWNDNIPGYNESAEIRKETFLATLEGGIVSKYPDRKDQLIEIYANRDPRLNETIMTPYSTYNGWVGGKARFCEFVVAPGTSENNGYLRDNRGWFNYFWRKFVPEGNMDGALTDRSHTPIHFPMLRYADVLLMLAECYNENGEINKAVDLINEVRQRPSTNMPAINSGPSYMEARDKQAVFERIVKERAIELAGEGHRFSDLRRWNLASEKMNFSYSDLLGNARYVSVFTDRDMLWPIPGEEMERNDALKPNNPGW